MILIDILTGIFIGLIAGMFSVWIRSLIGDPSTDENGKGEVNTRAIFSFIGVYFLHKYLGFESRVEKKVASKTTSVRQAERMESRMVNRFKVFICPYCFVVWVCFAFCPLFIWITGISWWNMVYMPSMGHLFLKWYYYRFE